MSFNLNSTVVVGRALLHTAAEYVRNGHTRDADRGHRALELLELILLCDDDNLAHLYAVGGYCAVCCACIGYGHSLSGSNGSLGSVVLNGFNLLLLAAVRKLNVHRGNEVRIGSRKTVLCGIQTNDFLVAGYAKTNCFLQNEEQEEAGCARPSENRYHTECLNTELLCALAEIVEQTDNAVLTLAC